MVVPRSILFVYSSGKYGFSTCTETILSDEEYTFSMLQLQMSGLCRISTCTESILWDGKYSFSIPSFLDIMWKYRFSIMYWIYTSWWKPYKIGILQFQCVERMMLGLEHVHSCANLSPDRYDNSADTVQYDKFNLIQETNQMHQIGIPTVQEPRSSWAISFLVISVGYNKISWNLDVSDYQFRQLHHPGFPIRDGAQLIHPNWENLPMLQTSSCAISQSSWNCTSLANVRLLFCSACLFQL